MTYVSNITLENFDSFAIFRSHLDRIDIDLQLNKTSSQTILFHEFKFIELSTIFLVFIWVRNLSEKFPGRIVGRYGDDPIENYYLSQMGIRRLAPDEVVRMTLPQVKTIQNLDTLYIKSANAAGLGNGVETKLSCEIADLLLSEDSTLEDREKIEQTAAAIAEALANVRNWAYQNSHVHPLRQNWWLMGAINPSQTRLRVRVFDEGTSIPSHLTDVRLTDPKVRTSLNITEKSQDADKISAALEYGTHRDFGMKGRRRGLLEMRNLTKLYSSGKFSVSSGMGHYHADAECGKVIQTRKANARFPIGGTLIGWELNK